MLDPFTVYEELRVNLGEQAAKVIARALSRLHEEILQNVTKVEFNELKAIVADLAKSQKELAEAQKRTEKRVEELAEAQKKTEESLNKLIKRVDRLEDQLGGLSMAVGYGIEDKLYPHMKNFAENVFGVEPHTITLREHIIYPDGTFDEVNIYIEGLQNKGKAYVVGECKAQPEKKDIERFMKMINRLSNYKVGAKIYPFVVGYVFHPSVIGYLKTNYPELKYFKTYEIEFAEKEVK